MGWGRPLSIQATWSTNEALREVEEHVPTSGTLRRRYGRFWMGSCRARLAALARDRERAIM